jgi:hypothetical protein
MLSLRLIREHLLSTYVCSHLLSTPVPTCLAGCLISIVLAFVSVKSKPLAEGHSCHMHPLGILLSCKSDRSKL